ncbi:MAG: peptidylprolyl isomerase [Bryobacteraceae bacterium]
MRIVVNGEHVDHELIRHEASLVRERLQVEMAEADDLSINLRAWEWARQNVIERILLRQAAFRDSRPVPPEAIDLALEQYQLRSPRQAACLLPRDQQSLRETIELDLRIERLLAQATATVPVPKNNEVTAFYKRNIDSFHTSEMVHAAHIVKNVDEAATEAKALEAIRGIKQMLNGARSFEEIADEHSDCPGRGGDLGFFARGEMVEEFESVVFDLAPGEISNIFRSPFGFHIAKVYDRRPAGARSLNEVRKDIERLIWNERKQEAIARYIDSLRSAADIRSTKLQE